MKSALSILLLLFLSVVASYAGLKCPVCRAAAVDTTSQKDDLSKPSKNLEVWNRSICANPFYGKGSYICPKDGYAYEAGFKTWNLSLNDHDRFAHALAGGIRSFPLPAERNITSGVVYSQEFTDLSSVKHSLLFWCTTDTGYFKKIRAYAEINALSLGIEKGSTKKQSIIRVSKRTK